ncbi:MAG: sugar transferase, partial [Candidatus Liptonbacteria bacterium]|nr:sugar transferase [Candidatus Liptonbacteria bacterium]
VVDIALGAAPVGFRDDEQYLFSVGRTHTGNCTIYFSVIVSILMAFDRRETAILLIGDFLILVASLWAALLLRNLAIPSFGYFEQNLIPFLPVFLLSLFVFYIAGLYEKQTRPIRSVMGIRILGAQAVTAAIAAILFFILPLSIAPKTILVLYLVVSVISESAWRFHRMNHEMKEGERVPVILVGAGPAADELYEEVNNNNKYMIRFVGRVDKKNPVPGPIPTMNAASLYEEIFDRVPLEMLSSDEMLAALSKNRVFYDRSKRAFDIILALVLVLAAVPFVVIAAFALYLESGAPFMRPKRIGKDGSIIRLLKLRSMLFDDNGDPELQKKNRVTTIGRFLRKTRIDELPQLWNVLTGDLSFIGPRPEFPKIAEVYEHEIPQYRIRHLVAPGLSGWAQIHDYDAPRGGADVARTRRKLSFDLYYLKHRSFGLDLAIAIKTLRTLASFSGS